MITKKPIPFFSLSGGLLALLLQLLPVVIWGQQALKLSDKEVSLDNPAYYIDPSAKKDINEVAELYDRGSFEKWSKTDTIAFNEDNNYWIRFKLKNSTEYDGQWVLDFQGWSYVELFQVERGVVLTKKQTGHLLDYNDRNYPAGNKSHILQRVPKDSTHLFYAKLNPAPNNSLTPQDLTITVMPRSTADRQQTIFRSLVLAFLAIYIVFFIYNFFIYLSTRDNAYLYYLCLVVLGFFLTLNYSGYFFEVFSFLENTYKFQLAIENFIYNGFSIFLILFTHRMFQVKKRYPKWYKGSLIMMAIFAVNTLVVYFDYELGMMFSMPTFLFFTIATIIFAIKNISAGYTSAVFYLIGFGTVFLAGIINILAVQVGVVERNMFTASLVIPLGQVIEMLFYSFALANRINVLKAENEKKNLRIIEFLEERKDLQEKINRELENKVQKRTLEIEEQKKAIELEKLKSDRLLLNILPSDTAEELKRTGAASPKYYKQVTIIFTDFERFSSITQEMDSEKLVYNLDHCFKKFDEIVDRYDIEKIKTIGDSYMCAAGISDFDRNYSNDAVSAALEMRDFVDQWNAEKEKNNEMPWRIRIGMHTGPVTAGVVGKKKFAFDIWGPTVNLASRMEASCEPGKVNISSATYNLVKENFTCVERGEIKVKNIGSVEMYFADHLDND